MPFKALKLSDKLIRTIEKLGYQNPTEIQEKAIPTLLEKRDLLATSQTGTGKTAAFVLPMLENIEEERGIRQGDERYKIKALILAPTRELVLQIDQKIKEYGEAFSHQSVALYGGIKLGSQIKAIRAGANIAVGTTGRVLDHLHNGSLNLSKVEMIVLDEADKMLEMGFINDIRTILSQLPPKRHSVMFSATFAKTIRSLAKSFLHNPIIIEIDHKNLSTAQVVQQVHYVNEEEKLPLLSALLQHNTSDQLLIFSNTKLQANRIVEHLDTQKITARAIHGDKSQKMRIDALQAFKSKKIKALVATDVAARGIDIINLPCVINFELPLNSEEYIHRIGRTGRASQKGMAISLVCKKEIPQLKAIEELINKKLQVINTEGFEYTPHTIPNNRKTKKEDRKKGVNLKKAKELAEKMMAKDRFGEKNNKKKRKPGGQKPTNKRHF